MDIQSIIIEGGAKTLDLFIKAGLWDEARVFTGPQYWPEGIRAPAITGKMAEETVIGPDKLLVFVNIRT
jgi:diaminohydroxyphosphoribosylaminopyrimidine deaminase/5-amino-6-(5-phosphoribosylamino)uracil reductase